MATAMQMFDVSCDNIGGEESLPGLDLLLSDVPVDGSVSKGVDKRALDGE